MRDWGVCIHSFWVWIQPMSWEHRRFTSMSIAAPILQYKSKSTITVDWLWIHRVWVELLCFVNCRVFVNVPYWITWNVTIRGNILNLIQDDRQYWVFDQIGNLVTSSLSITSSSNNKCIVVLISVQYKAYWLLLVLIPDPVI